MKRKDSARADDWPERAFGELVEAAQNGYSARRGEGDPTVVLRLADVRDGKIVTDSPRLIPMSNAAREKYCLKSDDLLAIRVNGSRDLVGRVIRYGLPDAHAYCDHFIRYRLRPGIDARFVELSFKDGPVRMQVESRLVSSAGQHTVSQGTFRDVRIRVPPLDEQRRIVAKIESLFERSRRAKAALDAIPPLLDNLRQSILTAAIRGHLTKDWRAQNPKVEPAQELLARIREERRHRWEQAELAKMRAKGKEPKNDKWKAKYKEPAPAELSQLPALPPGWGWTTLDHLTVEMRNGISKKPDGDETGLPILRISAVRPLSVNLDDQRFLQPSPSFGDFQLEHGDLLFTRYSGNPDYVGVCGAVGNVSAPIVYPDKLIRTRLASTQVLSPFVEIVANAGASLEWIRRKRKTAAGQVGIAGGDLKRTPIPIAPAGEQEIIVRIVTRALATCRVIEGSLRQQSARVTAFENAVLRLAFEGNLVTVHAPIFRGTRSEGARIGMTDYG